MVVINGTLTVIFLGTWLVCWWKQRRLSLELLQLLIQHRHDQAAWPEITHYADRRDAYRWLAMIVSGLWVLIIWTQWNTWFLSGVFSFVMLTLTGILIGQLQEDLRLRRILRVPASEP